MEVKVFYDTITEVEDIIPWDTKDFIEWAKAYYDIKEGQEITKMSILDMINKYLSYQVDAVEDLVTLHYKDSEFILIQLEKDFNIKL